MENLFLYEVASEHGTEAAGVIHCVLATMPEVLEQLNARFPGAGRIQVRKISRAKLFA